MSGGRWLAWIAGVTLVAIWLAAPATADEPARAATPGQVLLLRHARAPGVGDPAGFRLGDCQTQRNLDAAGREQAAQLGARLRALGWAGAPVYTSRWCRARDTATLLGLGPVVELPALDSFFAEPTRRTESTAALREFLRQRPRDAPPTVLVTHQVNITALTSIVPREGQGVLLHLTGDGEFRVVAEWAP